MKRPLMSPNAGTFDQIHQNVLNALRGNYIDKVDLRINLDRDNLESAGELLKLVVRDEIQDRIRISIGIITGTLPNEECGGADSYCQEKGFSEDEAIAAYLEVARLAQTYGFQIPETMATGPWCIARHPNAWMVGPDGEIYRCLSMVGREEGVLGHLPEVPSNQANEIETKQRMHQCLSEGCPLVPICGGGCLFENHVNGQSCPKRLLTEINKGLLGLQYG